MVEFGLKLEDNKVEQWSDKYIDYEKLKSVLKKAKVASSNVEELKKKLPREIVEGCTREFADYKAQEEEQRQQNAEQLKHLDGENAYNKQNKSAQHFELSSKLSSRSASPLAPVGEEIARTDMTPLLLERKSSFGSQSEHSTGGGSSMKRQNSWGSFSHTVFKVTSYLGFADDKKVFYKSLQDADDKVNLFRTTYDGEVQKVKHFYQDKLHELSEHIEAIIESVDTSHIKQKPKKSRKSSLIDDLVMKFENVMHVKKASVSSVDNIPSIRMSVSCDSSEDLLDSESPLLKVRSQSSSDKLDLERESDSIKRALTDVYRNAKMLHNYAIMVRHGSVYRSWLSTSH